MAIDPTQLLSDAACIEACIPPGMIPAAQLGQMVLPSVVVTTAVGQPGGTAVNLLMAANPKRRRAILFNNNAGSAVSIGPSTVTVGTGLLLAAGPTNITARLEVFTQGELYQAGGTVGQTTTVMEFLTP